MLNTVIVAAALLAPSFLQARTGSADGRSYVTGYFALDLDGVKCGLVQSVKGGDARASIITTRPTVGAGGATSTVTYTGLEVQMGLSMGQPVKDWIDASLAMNYMRKSGELKSADFRRQVTHVREFKDALLTEIGFPACDNAAKDAAFMTLKFSPWIIRNKKGDGSKVDNPADMAQKQWHPSDFRFTIDGLEKACAKVTKIDAFAVKISPRPIASGRASDSNKEPSRITYPNLRFTISEEYAQDFHKWLEETVKAGPSNPAPRKSGTLVYLNRTRQKELLTLSFQSVGIYKISAAPRSNNEDKIASVTVELSCKGMAISRPAKTAHAGSSQ